MGFVSHPQIKGPPHRKKTRLRFSRLISPFRSFRPCSHPQETSCDLSALCLPLLPLHGPARAVCVPAAACAGLHGARCLARPACPRPRLAQHGARHVHAADLEEYFALLSRIIMSRSGDAPWSALCQPTDSVWIHSPVTCEGLCLRACVSTPRGVCCLFILYACELRALDRSKWGGKGFNSQLWCVSQSAASPLRLLDKRFDSRGADTVRLNASRIRVRDAPAVKRRARGRAAAIARA